LKQALTQKPKASLEGVCLLKPKATDKALMKTLPPPEEPVDDAVSTMVVDSDDEHDYPVASATVAVDPEPTPAPTPTPTVEPVAVAVEEVAPKKKIVRKKADA
jgi:hypothetical protein